MMHFGGIPEDASTTTDLVTTDACMHAQLLIQSACSVAHTKCLPLNYELYSLATRLLIWQPHVNLFKDRYIFSATEQSCRKILQKSEGIVQKFVLGFPQLVCKQGKVVDQRTKREVIGEAAKLICPFTRASRQMLNKIKGFFGTLCQRFRLSLPLWNKRKAQD